jgi:hypothetical protein
VLIAFRLNDMKIDPYIRTKGERAGNRSEPGIDAGPHRSHQDRRHPGLSDEPGSKPRRRKPRTHPRPKPRLPPTPLPTVEPAVREPAGEVEEQEPALAASF